MLHEIEDIEHERLRLHRKPTVQDAPPVLCAFDVRTNDPVEEFSGRLRSVLDIALQLAVSQPFDGEDLPIDSIPEWFRSASRGADTAIPGFAEQGMRGYASTVSEQRWDLQEWLYQFDPESEFRGWSWWDLTVSGDREARIWVDSWGESFFACNELGGLRSSRVPRRSPGPAL
ncbi:hypothetical protein ACFQVC_19000 [Streptomyces monticola]|uniref:DUF1963 domain-containing protein n=1 Tax=Streptomyces monticola TaxID=2666263 RepID=A0ABW2JK95_9ACTN